MDLKKGVLCCFVLLVVVALLAGCTMVEPKKENPEVASDVKEYFPMTGSWSYRIEPGLAKPLSYHASDLRILRSPIELKKRADGSYLKLRVFFWSQTEDGEAALVEVVRDDSGLLRDKYFYWMYSRSDMDIYQVIVYPQGGGSAKPLLFLPYINGGISRPSFYTGSEDTLSFLTPDNKPPECREQPCLHFLRTITPGDGTYGYTDSGFTEEMWYARNKGLVRLEQKVNGVPSMTWILEQYVPS